MEGVGSKQASSSWSAGRFVSRLDLWRRRRVPQRREDGGGKRAIQKAPRDRTTSATCHVNCFCKIQVTQKVVHFSTHHVLGTVQEKMKRLLPEFPGTTINKL